MKKHITKLVAVLCAVLMMVSLAPAAALSDFNLPALFSVFGGTSATDTANDAAADGSGSTNSTTEAETAIPTEDGTPVSPAGGENLYIADDGTLYMDTDNDGTAEPIVGDTVSDEDMPFNVTQGKITDDEIYYADSKGGTNNGTVGLDANGRVPKTLSAYEPTDTDNEFHPFLQGEAAWIDLKNLYYGAPATQNFPVTDWSANTSVYNITGTGEYYSGGKCDGEEIYLFPDKNLIDGYTFAGYTANTSLNTSRGNIHGVAGVETQNHTIPLVLAKSGATEAYAYNRYDAMQGKYGITLDENVQTVRWAPSYVDNYYPNGDPYYGSVGFISDTPYLYFSTEAPESTQMAISLLLGTPVQKEVGGEGGTVTTNTGYFEYRWYTITDNSERPGVENDSRDLSMIPKVTISDPVGVFYGESLGYKEAAQQQNGTIIPGLESADKLDPIALAQDKGINPDTLYTDGSITGCYDFSNILPTIYGNAYTAYYENGDAYTRDNGRQDAQFKIAQIRVDVKTKDGAEPSASRVNYLYFGPSLVTTYLPQTTDGNNICAANWQYSQKPDGANSIGTDGKAGTNVHAATDTATERAYTSGWENGAAVSIVNTPDNPQLYTVDIHGKGDGQLIDWSAVPSGATIRRDDNKKATKVWKFTDKNGVVQYMEAEDIGDPNGSTDAQMTGNYVVMVTIPVRKWANVLGEARKISLTTTLLNAGKDASGKTNAALRPSFVFWGNDDGALGYGHGNLGTRFRHEDLLMTFGQKYQVYHTDSSGDYVCAEVDRTIGDSTIYNAPGGKEESWYDCLRSPYFYDQTVKNADSKKQLTEKHAGYAFITSLRFAMPIDSAISIQNLKGDGNSAGLNTYSASGEIVTAYDGGTGAQPEINVSNSLSGKTVSIAKKSGATGNTPSDYTYTYSNGGTIKGTIKTGSSAAYGPMLRESYYTIYDLLDTELITATSAGSHMSSAPGKENIPVYGDKWKNNKNEPVPIYSGPRTNSSIYGYVYENCECTIYYRLNVTNTSGSNIESWGLTGVVTKGGTPELGWVPLWISGKSYSFTHIGGTMIGVDAMTRDKVVDDWYAGRNQLAKLKNSWVLSNLNGGYGGNFYGYDGSTNVGFNYGDGSADYAFPKDIHNPGGYDGNTLHYANGWNDPVGGTNSGPNINDSYLYSANGTDLVFGMKRKNNTTKNWSVAMTRVFDEPITLKQGKTWVHGSYPVLYLDYDVTDAGSNSAMIVLSATVDGTPTLFHAYGSSGLTTAHHGLTLGNNNTRYFSFEKLMNDNSGKEIKITGLSLYMWVPSSSGANEAKMTLRRCEVWQEETDWLDDIISANQQSGGNTSTNMNDKVLDSMNIVNDAFYNVHNEGADGSYTVTKTDATYANLSGFGKDGDNIFTITDKTNANSLRKSNSNKGWTATIVVNDDSDKATVGGSDTTYHSYDGYGSNGTYQYSTAVGNLRVWCPANMDGSIVFESDRSYNTKTYKYLYYSYSMRDVDTGISAEETVYDADITKKGPGMTMAIKSTHLGSASSYLEHSLSDGTRTLAYYPSGHAYWAEDGRDARTYVTSVNAAIDLSTLSNINSVNQFVLYFNNPYDKQTEFYVNYIKLSNVAPEALIADRLEKEGVQYYYLMDNTGDRYSARFPTIDNPSGAVSGINSDNDRNNPIIVDRGAHLSEGHYFNGDPLYGYGGTSSTSRVFDESTASKGYYEKTYGHNSDPNAEANGSFKNIWFYAGDDGDSKTFTDIKDVYMYKQRDGSGEGTIEDMLWSYGRWYLGAGESGLNNMYIGTKDDPSVNETKGGVSGNLVRRYATENYVLLRSGIMPRRYQTYYDSSEGQFVYDVSNETLKDGIQLDENSYYITETVLYSQYTQPMFNSKLKQPIKYGYTFDGWYTTDDIDVNQTGSEEHMFRYLRKQKPNLNYFYAKWSEDPAYNNVTNDATFYDINGKVWFTQTANRANQFKLVMPDTTQVAGTDGAIVPIRGWRIKGDTNGTIYAPGQKIVLQKDNVELEPVTSTTSQTDLSLTITLHGAKLYLIQEVDANGKYTGTLAKNHVDLNSYMDKGYHGITITQSGNDYTYHNVPRDIVLVAVPISKKPNGVWSIANTTSNETALETDQTNPISGSDYLNGTTMTLVSVNNAEYQFSAYENMEFTYSALATNSQTNYKDTNGAVATMLSSTSTVKEQGVREMVFVSSFDLSKVSNAKAVAWGTLYTKNMAYNRFGDDTAQANAMKLKESSINATSIAKGSFETANANVRQVKATAKSASNQYYLRVTEVDGKKVWYFARSYVIYTTDNGATYNVAYSSVVRKEVLNAVEVSADL